MDPADTPETGGTLARINKREVWAYGELEKSLQALDFAARYLVLKLKCQEPVYLSQLKKHTPSEQWPAVFQTLLGNVVLPRDRMALYHFEGMLDELFEELCQHPSFDDFLRYEAELREWNPQRTLTYFIEILKREMVQACDRKQYRRVIGYLPGMNAYPGGPEVVKQLADYWHVHHRNRPAMKDELKKAGYSQK